MLTQLSNLPSPVQRRVRLLASLGTAVLLLVIGWHLLVLLIPLLISAIAAVMLMPLMRLGERSPLARRWPRLNRLSRGYPYVVIGSSYRFGSACFSDLRDNRWCGNFHRSGSCNRGKQQ